MPTTDASEIAKAVADEIERREAEKNEPLSISATIWFILVVMSSLLIAASYVIIPTAQQLGIKTLSLNLFVGFGIFGIVSITIMTLLYGKKFDAYLQSAKIKVKK